MPLGSLASRMPAWYRACASGQVDLLHPGVARVLGAPATHAAAHRRRGPRCRAGSDGLASISGQPVGPAEARRRSGRHLAGRSHSSRLARRGCPPSTARPRRSRSDASLQRRHVEAATRVSPTWVRSIPPVSTRQSGTSSRTASPHPLLCAGHSRRTARRGRHGVRALREALDDWLFDGAALDSELERKMKRLAKRYRLPADDVPRRDRRLRGRLPDHRDADRARVRWLGIPRQAAAQVRVWTAFEASS